jgi:hypothetical protein
VELRIACTERVKTILRASHTKDITPGKVGYLSNEVRKRLADELKEISGFGREIMKKSSR